MSMPSPHTPLRHRELTLGQAAAKAVGGAFAGAAILSALYALVSLIAGANGGVAAVISRAGTVFIILLLLLFLGRLVWLSRSLQDRAFTWVGFFATFFGLAMLLIFFVQLGVEVYAYFEVTPALIEQANQKHRSDIERQKQLEKVIQAKLAEIEEEMQAELANTADEKEKEELRRFYKEKVIPNQIGNLQKSVEENIFTSSQFIREDTGPGALFGHFLRQGPSGRPQDAGIWPALLGSLWLAVITMLFAVPIGVGAALYLEEYKTSGRLGSLIQVNINNLAGVPSVVYGILGAFVFVEMIFKPLEHVYPTIAARNVVGGGLTLGLLTLPVVIVAAQEAIRAVPSSIRQGAYALGATKWQVIWHQVLPLARPGILTGTILAVSRAIGEAAPLILFGALLFVSQDHPSLFSRFTVMPMQIYDWAARPTLLIPGSFDPAVLASSVAQMNPLAGPLVGTSTLYGTLPFETVEAWKHTAALASVVLLVVLLAFNAIAIILRNRAQRRVRW
jgi:phosphate ABC transporter permease subunit PstA